MPIQATDWKKAQCSPIEHERARTSARRGSRGSMSYSSLGWGEVKAFNQSQDDEGFNQPPGATAQKKISILWRSLARSSRNQPGSVTFHWDEALPRSKVLQNKHSRTAKQMKTKYIVAGLVMLITAGGWWTGRTLWRVHRQLVSLDVRNMPLGRVLHKIERQTWKQIRAERALDARITLRVKDKPLKYVLDRIAEQSGARWSTLYAVYQSTRARQALETALAGDGKIADAGWTKVAPKEPEFDAEGGAPGPLLHSQANPEGGSSVVGTEPPPGGPPSGMNAGGMMMFRHNPGGAVMFSKNANGQTEMWSPEELVMETPLSARLGADKPPAPTAQAAEEAAQELNGKWAAYLAFRKSIMGVGATIPGRAGGNPLKRSPNDRFAKLTPEQRVQRVRERRNFEAGGVPGQ